MKQILILALLIRLLVMPFFFHPDIKSQYFHFQFLSQGVLNIYQYLDNNKSSLPYQDTFNYLPLTYFTFGITNIVLSPFQAPNFTKWINDWGPNKYDYPNLPFYLLVLKIPYLVIDFLMALILFKLTKSLNLMTFWFLNPINIYLIYILGNFDILPAFLTLLSYYLLQKNRSYLSFFILGLAVAIKFYPLIFIPFYFPYFKKNYKRILLFISPIIISVLPFLFSSYFLNSFLGSGLTQKLLEFKLINIPLFPILYILIFTYSIFKNLPLYISVFLLSLIFFPLVKFHPQWIMWFLPFIYITAYYYPKLSFFSVIYFIFLFLYTILLNDQFLSFGHLVPIDTSFLLVRTPYDIVRYRFLIDPIIIQNYLRILLTVLSIYGLYIYEKSNRHHN